MGRGAAYVKSSVPSIVCQSGDSRAILLCSNLKVLDVIDNVKLSDHEERVDQVCLTWAERLFIL